MIIRRIALPAALACLVVSGCSSSNTVTGNLELNDYLGAVMNSDGQLVGEPCHGWDDYSDIEEGADVILRSSDGDIAAVTTLDQGIGLPGGHKDPKQAVTCAFSFQLEDVPESDFYQLSIAGRKPLTYKREALEADGWRVDLEIGES